MRPARALLALALLAAAPAAADWRSDYLDGRRALERGRPAEARALLAAAAAARPDEQVRARLVGVIPEPYLPHHYLGQAHFALHDCAAALAAWATSERQGAVAAFPERLTEVAAGRRSCGPGVASRDDARVKEAGVSVAVPTGAAILAPPPTADEAPSRKEVAGPAPEPLPPAAEPVAVAAATPTPPSRSEASAPSPRWAPSATLRAAAAAYLDGDYAGVLDRLAGTTPAEARSRLWTRVLRAAAAAALHRLVADPDAHELARREVEAVRREAPDFRPPPEAFPPWFVALFRD